MELDCVSDQVLEELCKLRGISRNRWQQIVSNNSTALIDRHFQIHEHLPKHVLAVCRLKRLATCSNTRINQQILDQRLHPLCPIYGKPDEIVGIRIELALVAPRQKLHVA